jgi:hypothetical protein
LEVTPNRGFDFSEWDRGSNFEANDNALVPFFCDGRAESAIECVFLFWEVFDINLGLVGGVEKHIGVFADNLHEQALENERGVGRRSCQWEFDPCIITR